MKQVECSQFGSSTPSLSRCLRFRAQGLGFRVQGLGFRAEGLRGLGFRAEGLGLRVSGSRAQGSGFRFRVDPTP